MSHIIPNKPWFLEMLSRSFFPQEISSIMKALEKKDAAIEIPKIIKKIEKTNYDKYDDLEDLRNKIVKDLKVEDEVELQELETLPPIKIKMLQGNFERGKRR